MVRGDTDRNSINQSISSMNQLSKQQLQTGLPGRRTDILLYMNFD